MNNIFFLYYDFYNDFRSLVFILKGISFAKKINYNLYAETFYFNSIISDCQNLGGLRNENLIEFIENEYSLLKDIDLSKIVSIGIELENINNKFLEKWNK